MSMTRESMAVGSSVLITMIDGMTYFKGTLLNAGTLGVLIELLESGLVGDAFSKVTYDPGDGNMFITWHQIRTIAISAKKE